MDAVMVQAEWRESWDRIRARKSGLINTEQCSRLDT